MKYIILLRGIMPFGKNKVPMADLRDALTNAGLESVQTYIQTGNVVAQSDMGQSDLEKVVHEVIKENIGADVTVIARTVLNFKEIFEACPFEDSQTSKIYFTILATHPEKNIVNDFLSMDFSPEKVIMVGDVLYTLYATKYSDSKFNNNFFENKLKVSATTRNFNTMNKMVQLSKK